MSGIGAIGGASAFGQNPLSGMGGSPGMGQGSGLSGMGDLGLGSNDDAGGGGSAGSGLSLGPSNPASASQGAAFGDTLRSMVIENPSVSKAHATDLAARFASGDTSIDPHQIAIANAKAGVEIQMATRTISSAVSAVRTLFQMQV
jgi:flagellar hook-basal body complex protein FliE